jgi:hypothetical protein
VCGEYVPLLSLCRDTEGHTVTLKPFSVTMIYRDDWLCDHPSSCSHHSCETFQVGRFFFLVRIWNGVFLSIPCSIPIFLFLPSGCTLCVFFITLFGFVRLPIFTFPRNISRYSSVTRYKRKNAISFAIFCFCSTWCPNSMCFFWDDLLYTTQICILTILRARAHTHTHTHILQISHMRTLTIASVALGLEPCYERFRNCKSPPLALTLVPRALVASIASIAAARFGHHRFGGRDLTFRRFGGCTRPVSVVAKPGRPRSREGMLPQGDLRVGVSVSRTVTHGILPDTGAICHDSPWHVPLSRGVRPR